MHKFLKFILAYYAWPRTPSTKVTRKERNPWRQHVHRATRPRSYAIDKVWEAVTSRYLGNGRSDGSYKQYGGVKSIICYLCFMQHAWSCCFFFLSFRTWCRLWGNMGRVGQDIHESAIWRMRFAFCITLNIPRGVLWGPQRVIFLWSCRNYNN